MSNVIISLKGQVPDSGRVHAGLLSGVGSGRLRNAFAARQRALLPTSTQRTRRRPESRRREGGRAHARGEFVTLQH